MSDFIDKVRERAKRYKEDFSLKNEAEVIPFKNFPLEVFPQVIQDVANSAHEVNGFSRDFVTVSIMASIASVAGNGFKIRLKASWHEPCIFWFAIVGSPGVAKSPALKIGVRPLKQMEIEFQKEYEARIKEWSDNGEEGPKPVRESILTVDSTIEAMMSDHVANPNGLLKFSDELIGWVKEFDKYRSGKGGDIENWLKIYDNDFIKITRMGRDTQIIPNACVSVLGGIQPGVLEKLAGDGRDENGFIHRLLFVYPEHKRREGWSKAEIPFQILDVYAAGIWQIYKSASIATKSNEINILPMDTEAEAAWAEWKTRNDKLINATDIELNQQVFSKIEKICARLALLLQICYWAYESDQRQFISKRAMEGAIKLAEYFRYMAAKTHQTIQIGKDERLVHINQSLKEGKTQTQIADELNLSKGQVSKLISKNPWVKNTSGLA